MIDGVIQQLAQEFTALQPNVQFDIALRGTGEVTPALTGGSADLGVTDRGLMDEETNKFVAAFGVPPIDFPSAVDAMAVVVQSANPIAVDPAGLTLVQLDGIYSKTLKRGGPAVVTWGDVGVTDPNWATQAIKPYFRPDALPAYFNRVCLSGPLKDGLTDPGVGTAVMAGRPPMGVAVGQDSNGIQLVPRWYADRGLADHTIRPVALIDESGNHIRPTYSNVINGTYPLGTILSIKAINAPTLPYSPAVREFLFYVFSKQGQRAVPRNGFGRLPIPMVLAERAQLEQ